MKTFEDQTFESWQDRDGGKVFENYCFRNCKFDNCLLSYTKTVALRSTVRDVSLMQSVDINSHIGPAIFDEVMIDGLKVLGDLLIMWGPLFRHVTVKGNIGNIKMNLDAASVNFTADMQRPFDEARIAFYKNVDWALDISEAQFLVAELTGIPASLIRRNSATQFVVKRENALGTEWRKKLSDWNDYWLMMINSFLADKQPDEVFVVPRSKHKDKTKRLLDGLKELRDLGVADPD